MTISERLKRAIGVALCDIDAKSEIITVLEGALQSIAAGSIGTTELANLGVTKAKLAAGISAPFMTFAAGQFTTVGGGVAEPISVPGMLGTDIALVAIMAPGAVPVTLVSAVAAADEIDLTFSGDPAADHIVIYQVLRATT